jgi:hypothetical protein
MFHVIHVKSEPLYQGSTKLHKQLQNSSKIFRKQSDVCLFHIRQRGLSIYQYTKYFRVLLDTLFKSKSFSERGKYRKKLTDSLMFLVLFI